MKCPRCKGTHIVKAGTRITVKGRKQRFQCTGYKGCGHTFCLEVYR